MYLKTQRQTTPVPDVASVTRELTFGTHLSKYPSFGARFFVRPKKIILIKRRGKSMEQKLLEIVQVTVLFHTDELFFVWSKTETAGRQNRSSGAKTWLLRRAGAKTSGAGVVCHVFLKGQCRYFDQGV